MEPLTKSVRSPWVPVLMEKWWSPLILGAVVYLIHGIRLYLHTYTRIKLHHVALAALLLALLMGGIFLLWASFWALAGRVFRHQALFAAHLAIPLLATLAFSLLSFLVDPLFFTWDLDRSLFWASMFFFAILSVWALFAHLHLVSPSRPRNLFVISVLVVGAICGLIFVGVNLVGRHVVRRSMTPFTLYPPSFKILQGKTVQEHLALLKSLQPLVDKDAREIAAEQSAPPTSK